MIQNFKQYRMKRRFKNFMTLSVKQIRTYVVATIMTSLAVDAVANISIEGPLPDPVISELFNESVYEGVDFQTILPVAYEAVIESSLNVESWMTTPFEIPAEKAASSEPLLSFASELVIEPELAIEDWMTMPFAVPFEKGAVSEEASCSPAP